MHITSDVKAMNKIMFFMANCGYNEVKHLLYNTFDIQIADHIFNKYKKAAQYSERPFFDVYFEVDSDCKKKICVYILNNFNGEQKI